MKGEIKNFEAEVNEKEKRLPLEKAQEEANMMWTINKKSETDYGRYLEKMGYKSEERPTVEDYDKALELIEEMKRLADEEPKAKKIFYKLVRAANRGVQALLLGLGIISSRIINGDSRVFFEMFDEGIKKFEDAEKKLRDMKKVAEDFENKD